ncbi:MAG: WecB/TagA/CpsF family glycosyltransferase [Phycisphaerae bacterium]|nr:WecB/TagA/CpsF family glycosyltransferase [Phycisphaerae bacterium]
MNSAPSTVESAQTLPAPVDVLGYALRPLREDELIEFLIQASRQRRTTTVAYLNTHVWNLARKDESLRTALTEMSVLYADGMSFVWAARVLGATLPERLSSADYFERLVQRCADESVSIFLLGGAPGVAERAAARLTEHFPAVRIVGTENGYFPETRAAEVTARVRNSRPDLLIVGMGTPRQEVWLNRHANSLDVPVCWCVGALMDYLAGAERRAPRWVSRTGLEWLFRLSVNPRGKWRRYLVGNPRFAWHVLRARFRAGRH